MNGAVDVSKLCKVGSFAMAVLLTSGLVGLLAEEEGGY